MLLQETSLDMLRKIERKDFFCTMFIFPLNRTSLEQVTALKRN